jgi:hypothetical protein
MAEVWTSVKRGCPRRIMGELHPGIVGENTPRRGESTQTDVSGEGGVLGFHRPASSASRAAFGRKTQR